MTLVTSRCGLLGAGYKENAGERMFEPTISARSEQLVEDSRSLAGDFLERQHMHQQRQQQRLLHLTALVVCKDLIVTLTHHSVLLVKVDYGLCLSCACRWTCSDLSKAGSA